MDPDLHRARGGFCQVGITESSSGAWSIDCALGARVTLGRSVVVGMRPSDPWAPSGSPLGRCFRSVAVKEPLPDPFSRPFYVVRATCGLLLISLRRHSRHKGFASVHSFPCTRAFFLAEGCRRCMPSARARVLQAVSRFFQQSLPAATMGRAPKGSVEVSEKMDATISTWKRGSIGIGVNALERASVRWLRTLIYQRLPERWCERSTWCCLSG